MKVLEKGEGRGGRGEGGGCRHLGCCTSFES